MNQSSTSKTQSAVEKLMVVLKVFKSNELELKKLTSNTPHKQSN